jgi:hypothetical protein
MDPTSPSKLVMSPGMPVFPVSPERVAGTRPPYGVPGTPQSPSLPDLRTSPLRKHRRDDSNVSALASMFENFQVTDPKEAHTKYLQNFEKQKAKHETEIQELKRKHADALHRLELRNEELKAAAKEARDIVEDTIPRDTWDEMRQKHREAIGKWEDAMRRSEETRKQAERKCVSLECCPICTVCKPLTHLLSTSSNRRIRFSKPNRIITRPKITGCRRSRCGRQATFRP